MRLTLTFTVSAVIRSLFGGSTNSAHSVNNSASDGEAAGQGSAITGISKIRAWFGDEARVGVWPARSFFPSVTTTSY